MKEEGVLLEHLLALVLVSADLALVDVLFLHHFVLNLPLMSTLDVPSVLLQCLESLATDDAAVDVLPLDGLPQGELAFDGLWHILSQCALIGGLKADLELLGLPDLALLALLCHHLPNLGLYLAPFDRQPWHWSILVALADLLKLFELLLQALQLLFIDRYRLIDEVNLSLGYR